MFEESPEESEESNSNNDSDASEVFEVPREFMEGKKKEVEFRLPGWGDKGDKNDSVN
jgi:hypothetical protein